MDVAYKPDLVEQKARKYWDDNRCFEVDEDPDKDPFYCLTMFPIRVGICTWDMCGSSPCRRHCAIPSHAGQTRLQPMGWDAFGMPAENAAIKRGVPPAKWTYQNIADMRGQFQRLGYGYDWRREVTTCKPEYYRWEQWLFTKLFEKGLVYRKNSVVNWDPVDQTVLANEQVIDGRGWRSDALVERREIPQWFMKITAYADELLEYLDKLPGWPDSVKSMQRNWIGRSEGIELSFDVEGEGEPLTVFTTRPDTLMGVTYMAVAAEHPLATQSSGIRRQDRGVYRRLQENAGGRSRNGNDGEKGHAPGHLSRSSHHGRTGPAVGRNFVLMSYGTGAVMAVPGHDQRDWEFATRHDLPITQVVEPLDGSKIDIAEGPYVDYGRVINSGFIDGMTFEQAFARSRRDLQTMAVAERRSIIACGTGAFRDSDTGARRFRLFIATIAMRSRCRRTSCR